MKRLKTVRGNRPGCESVRDAWHSQGYVDVSSSHVRPLRVVVAFLTMWAWTTGMLTVLAAITWGFGLAFHAGASLVYLVLFGIPAGAAMYEMEKRSLTAYVVAALVTSVPMLLISFSLGSWVTACIALAFAASGGVISYGIVERVGHRPVRAAMRSVARWATRAVGWFKTDGKNEDPCAKR